MNDDVVEINVDASKGDNVIGIGYVINGSLSVKNNKFIVGEYTSMEAELHALLEALRVASINFSSDDECVVYTDCQPLRDKIYGNESNSSEWKEYQTSAHWLLNKFDSWEVRWVSRSGNGEAHRLAREALFESREVDLNR